NPQNFVDLGYFSDIPKSEIFGACLWQMNKALDSPYKSLIKLAYLELLLKEEKQLLPLFSTKIQCLVTFPQQLPEQEQELPIKLVDPYLLLAREIISFYRRRKRTSEAELVRECLFMKTLEGILFRKGNKDLKQDVVLMEKWDILPKNYAYLIKNEAWNYHDLIEVGKRVHSFLLDTYKRLSTLQESFDSTATSISKRDIAILGKKLVTYYKKKENKIHYLRSISRNVMGQEDITLHRNTQEGNSYYWAYQKKPFTKTITNNEIEPIKEDHDLTRLLASLIINGVIQKKTTIHITPYFKEIHLKDIKTLVDIMLDLFPLINFSKIPAEEMLNPEKIIRALIVINMEKLDVRGSKILRSSIVTMNNYGEYFCSFCPNLVQLKNKMRYLLTKYYVSRWNNNLTIFIPPQTQKHYITNLLEK
ncbi:MAG: class I adenylate cyclase, partial [Thermodesulfobacteriota bacterium]